MDFRVFTSAFLTLFVAEVGDKTQLAVMTLSASTKKPWTVFLGGTLALALLTGLAAFFGETITKAVPEVVLRRVSASLFVVIGVWIWVKG
jgi:putative Ca2+/H+ antiporter (TMEM165/GDT1 family)